MRDFCKQIVSFVALCGASAAAAAAQSSYTVTDLGTLSGANSAKVSDINKSGQIVGTSANHAFLWSNGVMADLGTLGGSVSMAYSINDPGVVVGQASTASGEIHAFVWQNGKMSQLASLPGSVTSSGNGTQATAVNDNGVIVGSCVTSTGATHAVIWSNGKITDLNTLIPQTGITLTRATGINRAGQIVVEQQTDLDGPTTRAFLLTPKQH